MQQQVQERDIPLKKCRENRPGILIVVATRPSGCLLNTILMYVHMRALKQEMEIWKKKVDERDHTKRIHTYIGQIMSR